MQPRSFRTDSAPVSRPFLTATASPRPHRHASNSITELVSNFTILATLKLAEANTKKRQCAERNRRLQRDDGR